MKLRPLSVALLATALIGCAGVPASSPPSSPAPAATEAPATELDPSPASPTATPMPTASASSSAGSSPGGDSARATGSGSIRVDGIDHELEVALCGWQNGGRERPLEPEPGARRLFRLVAVRPVGAGILGLDLDWDGAVGVITVSVIQLDPDDPQGAFRYANERQPISFIDIDGSRVTSVEPLTVFDGSNISTANRHELEIDVTCDSFGGSIAQLDQIVAEILDIALPTPQTTGELSLGGERYELQVSSCAMGGDSSIELEAESPDGRVSLTLAARPGFTLLFLSLDGRVATPSGEIELAIGAGEVRTTGPIPVEIAGRGASEMTFSLVCP